MSVVSLFAFIFGALVGLTMAVLHFRGVKSGKALGLAHGALTVSGIVLLSSELALRNAGSAWWLVALFGVVALGGIYLFSRQVRDKPWPALVIVAHGGLALVGIAALALWLGGRGEPAATDGSVPAGTTENQPIPVEDLVE